MLDQVTRTKSWPNFPSGDGSKVENQVAAPAESSTPTLHGATIAQQRVRMEGWRQRWLEKACECQGFSSIFSLFFLFFFFVSSFSKLFPLSLEGLGHTSQCFQEAICGFIFALASERGSGLAGLENALGMDDRDASSAFFLPRNASPRGSVPARATMRAQA